VRVAIDAARGGYAGAPDARDNVIELVVREGAGAAPTSVRLNGAAMPRAASDAEFDAADGAAWTATADGILRLRSGVAPVGARKEFEVDLGS
jgi:hypothetical protein